MSSRVFGVSELLREVNAALAGFGEIWVRGELSGVKLAGSGHRYFSLKDARAQLSCAMWARSADRLRFKLTDGLAVLLRGALEVYPQRGALQLIVAEVVPEGIGELQLAFEQLKAKLQAEGLFAPERKRPLPALPQRLGLVTSATGAAVRDVLKVLSRWQHCSVLLYPVRVQGKGAEGEIARAIRYLARSGLVDVVLVVRGGGSLEDLWSFNEEIVARAIAASAVPVVTGVGHEIDFTMADFVADVRAATPTQAAELVIARLEEQLRRTEDADQRVRAAFTRLGERSRMRVESLAGARGLAMLPARLAELHQRLLRLEALPQRLRTKVTTRHRRLDSAATKLFHWPVRFGAPRRRELIAARMAVAAERLRSILRRRALELGGQERALEALSPRRVLRRGFSITQREGSSVPLTDPREVVPGEHIVTTLAQGTLRSLVQGARGMQADLFEDDDVAPGVRDRQETKGT